MAIKKISDLVELTTPASGDNLLINDVSESLAINKTKRITFSNCEKETQERLKKRDTIHNSIRLHLNVINDTNQDIRIGVKENIK